ncbi:MAG: hypothetical protein JXN10_07585 [Clostridia bacterium]|nr:hypothetical protein [Clostridia bacterium]MBN2883374.1 hypothetical protein [Clostridia bacterium]
MENKMTKEQALEILQLEPSATTEQIKKKYENFMRRAKFDDSFDEELVTKAYDTLMGYQWGNFEPDPVYLEKGINKKKIENFFYLYKRNLVYGIAVAAIVITVLAMILFGKVRYDYTIVLIGSLNIRDQAVMAEYYQELLDVDNVLVDYVLIQADSADGSLTEEGMNKLFGYFQSGEADLFVVTEETAKFLSYEGALNDLGQYLPQLGLAEDDDRVLYWYQEDEEEIAAAIHFGSNSIFTEGINGKAPEFVSLSETGELTENTKTIILDLLEQNR